MGDMITRTPHVIPVPDDVSVVVMVDSGSTYERPVTTQVSKLYRSSMRTRGTSLSLKVGRLFIEGVEAPDFRLSLIVYMERGRRSSQSLPSLSSLSGFNNFTVPVGQYAFMASDSDAMSNSICKVSLEIRCSGGDGERDTSTVKLP